MAEKLLQTPTPAYTDLIDVWDKCRSIISGHRAVLSHDRIVNISTNFLISFSPTMSQEQFEFYKTESELPGINSQFAKLLVGGLLRKPPAITFSDKVPKDVESWIRESFGVDGSSLIAVLDLLLTEEIATSRAWVYSDYPRISEQVASTLLSSEWAAIKPYPVLWKAEQVINWQTKIVDGVKRLTRVVVRDLVEAYADKEAIHPSYVDTIWVHELIDSTYQVRRFEAAPVTEKVVSNVSLNKVNIEHNAAAVKFELKETIIPKSHGKEMSLIPAWPLNGAIEPVEPELSTIIDKEIALYNKISRRNHLLYGAATYTPWISSDMKSEDFDEIVAQGLGTWIKLEQGDQIGALTTPTDALADLDTAIKAGLEEIARLGVRMLANEGTQQSGVALQIRNASQTANIGSLNTKISAVMRDVIVHMINRRYSHDIDQSDVTFTLCSDFDTVPLGVEWIRLIGEYYEKNLLPRSAWLELLKANDLLSHDYDDDTATEEMNNDELVTANLTQQDKGISTASKIKKQESQRENRKEDIIED